ncbi:DUF664 domain-containing protein [Nocardia sp. CA-290969]|uniref:mycothiol transferase n=1 Tax=Nocardia sp. CA-290969 TaxID=3239986 RepID=UPI003D8E59C9
MRERSSAARMMASTEPTSTARRRPVASLTTPIALVKHAGRRADLVPACAGGCRRVNVAAAQQGGGPSFVVGDDETPAEVIAEFERASASSRMAAADFEPDDIKTYPHLGDVSLRFVHLLLSEDFARHAGHADILREQIVHSRSPADTERAT